MECDASSDFNGLFMNARIASIFVLLAVSALGSFLPLLAKKNKFFVLPWYVLFVTRYFGSGVILATAFIHLLGEAEDSLNNPCVGGIFNEYSWASGISLMGTFVMFTIELVVSQISERHRRACCDMSQILEQGRNAEPGTKLDITGSDEKEENVSTSQEELQKEMQAKARIFRKVMNVFLLEFGIVFHSVFVGLSLAIAGEQFKTLFIAISFHQFFEGLGLGARFATTEWPANMKHVSWWLSFAYSITTPIGIGAGLGVRSIYLNNSRGSLIVVGVFDAFCSGLLIYNSLVELLARDFLAEEVTESLNRRSMFLAYCMLFLGCLLMAVIGKWA